MSHLIPIPVLPNPSNGSPGARGLDPTVARVAEIFDRMANKFQANTRLEYCLERERDGFFDELKALCTVSESIICINHASGKAMSQLSNLIAQMGTPQMQSADRRTFRKSLGSVVTQLQYTTIKFDECRKAGGDICSRLETRITTFVTAPNKNSKHRMQRAKEWAIDHRSVVLRIVAGFLTLVTAAISIPNLGGHPLAAALSTVSATGFIINEVKAKVPPSEIERRLGKSAFVQLSNLWNSAIPDISASLRSGATPVWVQPANTGTLQDWVIRLEHKSTQERSTQIDLLNSAVQEQHLRCGVVRQLIVQVKIHFLPPDDPSP